jgi:hypothetical protein
MKREDLCRETKRALWDMFDDGETPEAVIAAHKGLTPECIRKQHRLWAEFRTRNPNRK